VPDQADASRGRAAALHGVPEPVDQGLWAPTCSAASVALVADHLARAAGVRTWRTSVDRLHRDAVRIADRIMPGDHPDAGSRMVPLAAALLAWQLVGCREDGGPGVDPAAGARFRSLSGLPAPALERAVIDALASGCPVLCDIPLVPALLDQSGPGPLDLGGPSLGRHSVVVVGADTEADELVVQNSWGPRWGEGGRARLGPAFLRSAARGTVWVACLERGDGPGGRARSAGPRHLTGAEQSR
jgi:hypothetical protein